MYADAIAGYPDALITCSVVRIDPAFTTEPSVSAFVSCCLRKPSSRAQSATYGDGAYCACNPTSRSTAFTTDSRFRSRSSCRASSVRFNSRSESVLTSRPLP